ncbi:MAG TPA: hypothetical protein VGK44_13075 [Casimicrobiaceae bacterium]
MNGLLLLALILLAIGIVVAYRLSVSRASRHESPALTQVRSNASSEQGSQEQQSGDDSVEGWLAHELAEDRHRLFRALAAAREETARFRQLLIDLENNAPPPLLDSPTAPDDLKLIVGIGPVLERMLQQLGVSTYRQIARWTERDIDEFDARLPEFPGRIRRDAWVTQARELHHSKYG